MQRVTITAPKTAQLLPLDLPDTPIPDDGVWGQTLVSLVSHGTELNANFLGQNFPTYPGYACVFEVRQIGAQVQDLAPGDLVYCAGGHASIQRQTRANVVRVPQGLPPARAVFARLMAVSMSTLNTTTARPPSKVLVTGLGPVGNLAAQIFARCGYAVTAVDPVPARRLAASQCGLADVRATLDEGDNLRGHFALHVECSGHEAAVLEGCRAVRQRGEVVLVGVPWVKRTDLSAFDLLHAVFHRYVVVRSGWEWEVPEHAVPFGGNCRNENYAAAVEWIARGQVQVQDLATPFSPERCQEAYEGLLSQALPAPGVYFDWSLLHE